MIKTSIVPQHYKEWRYTPQTNGISILQMPSGPAPSIQVFNNSNNQIVVAGDQRTRVEDVERNYLLAAPAYSDVVADFPFSAFTILLQGTGTPPGVMDSVIVRLYDERQSPRLNSIPNASGGISGVNIAQLGGVNISGNLNTNVLNQPNVNAIPSVNAASSASLYGDFALTFTTHGSAFSTPNNLYGGGFSGRQAVQSSAATQNPFSVIFFFGLKGVTTGKLLYLATATSQLCESLTSANSAEVAASENLVFPFPISLTSIFPSDATVQFGASVLLATAAGVVTFNGGAAIEAMLLTA